MENHSKIKRALTRPAIKHLMYAERRREPGATGDLARHGTRCVRNVWSELTGDTHFNINELSYNDGKVPSARRETGVVRRGTEGPS